jgi:diketogulonate reductase-like aldo/keto reductase
MSTNTVPTGPADTVELRGGVRIPVLGLGVFGLSGNQTRRAVRAAIDAGYRHVDTASVYGNEHDVTGAVRAAAVAADVFVTTKVWNADHGFRETLSAFERSRRQLGVDVVDLYLVHWPVPGVRKDTWRAMEHLLEQGSVRAIGVSNYMSHHLEELLAIATYPPSVNQIELSPFSFRSRVDVVELCHAAGIAVQAYSPLTKGRLLTDPALVSIAARVRRDPAQVMLRWALQRGLIPLPKSTDAGRIASNAAIFDFHLSTVEMDELDALDRGLVTPGWDPTSAP